MIGVFGHWEASDLSDSAIFLRLFGGRRFLLARRRKMLLTHYTTLHYNADGGYPTQHEYTRHLFYNTTLLLHRHFTDRIPMRTISFVLGRYGSSLRRRHTNSSIPDSNQRTEGSGGDPDHGAARILSNFRRNNALLRSTSTNAYAYP